jgi:serine protease Do
MKKLLLLLVVFVTTAAIAGCTFLFPLSTTAATTAPTSTVSTYTTTSATIDVELIMSEIYNRLYADLYDDIRAEVAADLAQERFDAIYDQVVADLLAEIAAGNLEVTAATVIEQIYGVAAEAANAVIGVTAYDAGGTAVSTGSGVIYKHVGDQYYVVTNNHVVDNAATLGIVMADGTEYVAILRGTDATVDIAVLYFTATETYQTAAFGDSEAVTKGTIVLAVGNPSGYDYYGTMTMGIVSGLDRYFDIDNDNVKDMFVNYIQHDASINAGNSGGALFNLSGDVIGINVIKIAATEIEGMGFAIPANLVAAVCADIEEFGVSKVKPVLGITFVDIASNPDYFTLNGIELPAGMEHGFYVLAVGAGASFDGYVMAGDIVTRIGVIDIVDTADFVIRFAQYHVGDILSVTVWRNGGYLTFDDIELKPKAE